jgi:MoaA/NifB/PqqE/SkfB family radical SAM enzyme
MAKLLSILRQAANSLILSGGEPTLHPDVDWLVQHARNDLKFHQITLISNGSLIHQHENMIQNLDRLIISLDSTDPFRIAEITQSSAETASTILENIQRISSFPNRKPQVILNTVLTVETLPGLPDLLAFCTRNKLLLSVSPQTYNNWPQYDLMVSDEVREMVLQIIQWKRRGAPIIGSQAYFRTLIDFRPYLCHPIIIPRVLSNGDLIYPCRPIEKGQNGHGGRDINLLAEGSWKKALQKAQEKYGALPRICSSCFQQCYIEPSLMQQKPFELLKEVILYPENRKASIGDYAPG